MSDSRDIRKVEDLYGLVIEKLTEHVRTGEAVLDRDGNVVGRRLNAQLVKAAIQVAERAGVNVIVKPGSKAANLLKITADEVEGIEYTFPDEIDPQIN